MNAQETYQNQVNVYHDALLEIVQEKGFSLEVLPKDSSNLEKNHVMVRVGLYPSSLVSKNNVLNFTYRDYMVLLTYDLQKACESKMLPITIEPKNLYKFNHPTGEILYVDFKVIF